MPTDELMFTRLQEQFNFIKQCTKEEINHLKREISTVMDSGIPSESPSHLLQHVDFTLREFKQKAEQGEMTRDYHEAMESMEVCACGCGRIQGEGYWEEATCTNINGEVVHGYKLTSKWRNQVRYNFTKMCDDNTSTRSLRRALRCLNQ